MWHYLPAQQGVVAAAPARCAFSLQAWSAHGAFEAAITRGDASRPARASRARIAKGGCRNQQRAQFNDCQKIVVPAGGFTLPSTMSLVVTSGPYISRFTLSAVMKVTPPTSSPPKTPSFRM